jgi:DNA-binding response OmpR family regulator/anti-sigma regulatory factor (Ser/Thr protein kinase)
VQHNADQLLKLVNQLLSLAKLEAGALRVELKSIDVHDFLHPIVESFAALALQRHLAFKSSLPQAQYTAEIDPEKVEMIITNLLSNAVKFSRAPGHVSFEVNAQPGRGQLEFVVSDTGIGVSTGELDKIFDRFYQVNDGNAHTELGTGIGLALVKELTDILGGTIAVTSEPMKGSEFRFTIPAKITLMNPTVDVVAQKENKLIRENEQMDIQDESQGKAKLLVVEDNAQLRKFIIECFDTEFEFIEAANGELGLEQALLHCPDLIISDIMMPVLDGVEMTSLIRKDPRINHIPIIMLTAKATMDDKLEGLEHGAVDYITKPFDKRELLLKARNIVESQNRGRKKFRLEMIGKAPAVAVPSLDEQFLTRVKDAIHTKLSDDKLSVDFIAEEIGFSRTQLYRKVKAVTGLPVNELIRHYRMHRAAQLLQQRWGAVSQVAYEVGYSNPSYFSKVFKEEFGVLPSEYN